MTRILNKTIFIFLVCLFYFLFFYSCVFAAAPPELKEAIGQKSKELQAVTDQIKQHQENLKTIQGQSRNLEQEINRMNSDINQVNLDVRSSEITVDKLKLEIKALGYSINDTEKAISDEKETITKLLQEIQEKDGESFLIIFLKNKSLSESVSESQNLVDLNNGLTTAITDLKNTELDLSNKLKDKTGKKQATETEKENLKNRGIILNDLKKDKKEILIKTKNQERNYQKLISDLEQRQMEIAAEIEKMEGALRLKIDPKLLPTKRPGVLAMPVSGAVLSQDYGATKFARSGGYRGKWHNGVDLAAPIGTPVFAAEKGKVIAVGNQDRYCYRGAYGKFIVIEHENNLTTLYAHLSLQIVNSDDIVERGQLIGYVGRSGYATGPHLHFTVYASPTFKMGASRSCGPMPLGGDLNPMDYL